LLTGRASVDVAGANAGGVLPHESTNPLHDELVEVGCGDGDEAYAFEQGEPGIHRLCEDAGVEVEVAGFAVQVQRGVIERRTVGHAGGANGDGQAVGFVPRCSHRPFVRLLHDSS